MHVEHEGVSRLAADQHGRASAQQLLACGLTTKAIEVRLRRGQLHREHHGVYAVGHRAWTLDLLLRGRLPHPEVNKPLERLGRRIVPDFRWPAQRLVVEADCAAWHDGALAREDDAERQAILEAGGEHVIRITWDQALRRSEQSLQRVWAGWRG